MTVASPQTILQLCGERQLIMPFSQKRRQSGMTWGLSQAGYDIRIAQNVTLYPITLGNLILKTFRVARPSFILASSVEQFKLPNNMICQVVDKSSWARRGLALQNTQCEPGWRGHITLELSNHGDQVLKIEAGDPIAQIVFHILDQSSDIPYRGKYQDQPNRPVADIRDFDDSKLQI
jgi:dCTP deaminase